MSQVLSQGKSGSESSQGQSGEVRETQKQEKVILPDKLPPPIVTNDVKPTPLNMRAYFKFNADFKQITRGVNIYADH